MNFEFSSLELIKFALSVEEEGIEFYTENAAKATGENKELLLKLAADEKQHAAIFKKMYDEFEDNAASFDYLYDIDVESIFKSYAHNEIFEKRKEVFDNVEDVIALAIETEKLTVDYYTSLVEYAVDPLKGILERLIAEETNHYNSLKAL